MTKKSKKSKKGSDTMSEKAGLCFQIVSLKYKGKQEYELVRLSSMLMHNRLSYLKDMLEEVKKNVV